MPSYTLHLGDCLEVMPGIPAGSVDAIIADWPYGTTACKWDSVIPLEPLWEECKRVIKSKGAIVLTASQPFTTILIASSPYFGTKKQWFKYEWVWSKGRGTGFQIAKYKPLVSHENVVVFGNGKIGYCPQMRNRCKPRLSKNSGTTRQTLVSNGNPYQASKPLDKKYPITVLEFSNNNQAKKLHPTEKPVALMEYLIKTYTNPGDLVLDNTFGSCSTGEACLRTDRRFIGIEKDPGYFQIGKERMERVEEELRQAQIAKERQPYLIEAVS